jgi:hypothetical protein
VALKLATEFRFRLPERYKDEDGNVHRDGVMRLATAADEIIPFGDYRAADNKAYAILILLSRVITSIGGMSKIYPDMIETLSGADLLYLQELYEQINDTKIASHHFDCPTCGQAIEVDAASGAPRPAKAAARK